MFTPMNTSNSLLVAQAMTQFKGQEAQNRQSSEKKERERLDNLKRQQAATQQQEQEQAPNMKKGILA